MQDHSADFLDILESANDVLDQPDKHRIGLLVSGYYLFLSWVPIHDLCGIPVQDALLTPLAVDTLHTTAARLWREPDGILWLGGMVAIMEQQLEGMSHATAADLAEGKPDHHAAHHDPYKLIPSGPPRPRVI